MFSKKFQPVLECKRIYNKEDGNITYEKLKWNTYDANANKQMKIKDSHMKE